MLDVPKFTPEERLNHIIGLYLGNTMYPLWFMEEKFDKPAVEAYFEWLSQLFIKTVQELEQGTPMKLVMLSAVVEQNLMRSVIEVSGDDDKAVLKLVRCRRLAHALQWAKYGMGPERNLTRDGYCTVCLESGLRRISRRLGHRFEVVFTPEGCEQTLQRSDPSNSP